MVKMVEMVHLQADAPHTYLRPQDTWAARRYNQSLRIPPYASYPCDTLIGEPYPNQHIEEENSGLVTQHQRLSVSQDVEPYQDLLQKHNRTGK